MWALPGSRHIGIRASSKLLLFPFKARTAWLDRNTTDAFHNIVVEPHRQLLSDLVRRRVLPSLCLERCGRQWSL